MQYLRRLTAAFAATAATWLVVVCTKLLGAAEGTASRVERGSTLCPVLTDHPRLHSLSCHDPCPLMTSTLGAGEKNIRKKILEIVCDIC